MKPLLLFVEDELFLRLDLMSWRARNSKSLMRAAGFESIEAFVRLQRVWVNDDYPTDPRRAATED